MLFSCGAIYLDLCGENNRRILLHIRKQRRQIKPDFLTDHQSPLSFFNANENSFRIFSSSHKRQEYKPPGLACVSWTPLRGAASVR